MGWWETTVNVSKPDLFYRYPHSCFILISPTSSVRALVFNMFKLFYSFIDMDQSGASPIVQTQQNRAKKLELKVFKI